MRRINPKTNKKLIFQFENQKINCNEGETIASALLASGESIFRISHQRGSARGPYCMMGVCFDCLVEIDGTPNRQACMIRARNGREVRRQSKPPSLGFSEITKGDLK